MVGGGGGTKIDSKSLQLVISALFLLCGENCEGGGLWRNRLRILTASEVSPVFTFYSVKRIFFFWGGGGGGRDKNRFQIFTASEVSPVLQLGEGEGSNSKSSEPVRSALLYSLKGGGLEVQKQTHNLHSW